MEANKRVWVEGGIIHEKDIRPEEFYMTPVSMTTDTDALIGLGEALACDCDNTDGWEEGAPTIRGLIAALREMRDHISEQITHVEHRIKDGDELGARVWRIALEDVARENRAAIEAMTP